MRDLLAIHIFDKPLRAYGNGWTAVLQKDAVIPLIPGQSFPQSGVMADHPVEHVADIRREIERGEAGESFPVTDSVDVDIQQDVIKMAGLINKNYMLSLSEILS